MRRVGARAAAVSRDGRRGFVRAVDRIAHPFEEPDVRLPYRAPVRHTVRRRDADARRVQRPFAQRCVLGRSRRVEGDVRGEEPVRESVRRARRHGGVLGRDRHVEGAGGTVGRADHERPVSESLARRRRRALSVQGRRSQLERARAPCRVLCGAAGRSPGLFPCVLRSGAMAWRVVQRQPLGRSTSNRGRRRSSVSRK